MHESRLMSQKSLARAATFSQGSSASEPPGCALVRGVQFASSGGQQMGVLGQPRPDRLEGEQALRPRTEQQGVIVAVLAFGEADGQPVDGSGPRLHSVEPEAQRVTP